MYLVFTNDKEMLRLSGEKIVFVTADGNYSTITMVDGREHLVTYQIGQIEKMMDELHTDDGPTFIRIGKSHIVNLRFIYYINPTQQKLILRDNERVDRELNPSREALKGLKELFDKGLLK